MIKLPLKGGAGGITKCGRCEKHVVETVLFAGHDCLLYIISTGRDPRQYPHTKEAADWLLVPNFLHLLPPPLPKVGGLPQP